MYMYWQYMFIIMPHVSYQLKFSFAKPFLSLQFELLFESLLKVMTQMLLSKFFKVQKVWIWIVWKVIEAKLWRRRFPREANFNIPVCTKRQLQLFSGVCHWLGWSNLAKTGSAQPDPCWDQRVPGEIWPCQWTKHNGGSKVCQTKPSSKRPLEWTLS